MAGGPRISDGMLGNQSLDRSDKNKIVQNQSMRKVDNSGLLPNQSSKKVPNDQMLMNQGTKGITGGIEQNRTVNKSFGNLIQQQGSGQRNPPSSQSGRT